MRKLIRVWLLEEGFRILREFGNHPSFVIFSLENDDLFNGVRFARERLFRGSYAMCDAP